jgi:hypothetical protein
MPASNFVLAVAGGPDHDRRAVAGVTDFEYCAALVRVPHEAMDYGPLLRRRI